MRGGAEVGRREGEREGGEGEGGGRGEEVEGGGGGGVGSQPHIDMWQRLTNIGLVTGPGGLFATRLVPESGFCDKLPATGLL